MKENYEQMAEQFMNLWQEQVSAFLKNPDVINSFMSVWQKGGQSAEKPTVNIDIDTFYKLLTRLESCEKRIEQLESVIKQQEVRRSSKEPIPEEIA